MSFIVHDMSRAVLPMQTKGAQPGAPMTGALLTNLAVQTEKLWSRGAGSQHSFHWPHPDTAPTCSITVANTGTAFRLGDATENPIFEIPWHVPDGFNVSTAVVFVATRNRVIQPTEFAMRAKALLSAGTAHTTEYRNCEWGYRVHTGPWVSDAPGGSAWRLAKLTLNCGQAALHASRYLAFRFFGKVQSATTDLWDNATGFEAILKLYALRLYDIPADRSGLVDAGDGE